MFHHDELCHCESNHKLGLHFKRQVFTLFQASLTHTGLLFRRALCMNKMILENCTNRNTNLSIAWIDYKRAFDSVPHSWIE